MKKLFFKELQENRALPIGLGLLLLLLMIALKTLGVMAAHDTTSFLTAAWVAAAIFAASSLFSREVGNNTLQFLMALPVSRARVWAIKAAAGFVLMLLGIIATTVGWVAALAILFSRNELINVVFRPDSIVWLFLTAIACYSLSLAISTLLDRALSAAMVGLLALAAVAIPIALVCNVYLLMPGWHNQLTANVCLIATTLTPALLLASYYAFTRGESLRTPRRFKFAALGCAAGLAVVWTTILLGTSTMAQFHRTGNQQAHIVLSPDGKWAAVDALNWGLAQHTRSNDAPAGPEEEVYYPQYSLSNDHGSYRARHLVIEATKPTGNPSPWIISGSDPLGWSPDGRFLDYAKTAGPLGLGMVDFQFEVADVKTRSIHTFPWLRPFLDPNMKWSPDGRWLATETIGGRWVEFVARVQLERPEEAIDHRAVASTEVSGVVSDSYAERDSHAFSLVHAGSALQGRVSLPGAISVGGWSSDSRFFYAANSNALVAIEPKKILMSWGQTQNRGQTNASYPLCTLPPSSRLLIETSANPHRALATLMIAEPQKDGSIDPTFQAGLKESNWIIDLPAATADAVRQDRNRSLPEVEEWLHKWSTCAVPPGAAQGRTSISPDGRYLAVRRSDLQWSSVRNQSAADSWANANLPGGELPDTRLFPIDGQSAQVVPKKAGAVTTGAWWLPNGHEYVTLDSAGRDASRVLQVTDAATKESQAVPIGKDQFVGVDSAARLLLAPPSLDDTFHPIDSAISISALLPGGK